MKKYFIIVLSLAFPAFFFSCNESKFKTELKTIDSLNVALDSVRIKLREVDTVIIEKSYKEYLAKIAQLKNYFNDKKEDSTWQLMGSYGAIKTSLKPFAKNYTEYYSELEYSRKQLDSLKSDIESGNLEKGKIKDYTKTEAEAVSKLMTLVAASVEGAKTGLKLLDSLNPKVDKVIGRLKKEIKTGSVKPSSEVEDD